MVRALAWFVVVVGWLALAVIVAATVILAGWMFVEDWPVSLWGCLGAIALSVLVGCFVWLFCWARRAVAGKGSNKRYQQTNVNHA